jgi:hypothetical protein
MRVGLAVGFAFLGACGGAGNAGVADETARLDAGVTEASTRLPDASPVADGSTSESDRDRLLATYLAYLKANAGAQSNGLDGSTLAGRVRSLAEARAVGAGRVPHRDRALDAVARVEGPSNRRGRRIERRRILGSVAVTAIGCSCRWTCASTMRCSRRARTRALGRTSRTCRSARAASGATRTTSAVRMRRSTSATRRRTAGRTLYGALCVPGASKTGSELYAEKYGSFDPTWQPADCAGK